MASGSDEITEIQSSPGVKQQWVVGPLNAEDAAFTPDVTPSIISVADAEEHTSTRDITVTFLGVSNAENYPGELHWQGTVVSGELFEELLFEYLSNADEWDDESAMIDLAQHIMPDRDFTLINSISLSDHIPNDEEEAEDLFGEFGSEFE